jgi:ribosome-associated translation inhibitor RaiA
MHVLHYEHGLTYTTSELLLLARKLGKLGTYCQRLKDDASHLRLEAEAHDSAKAKDRTIVKLTVTLPKATLHAEANGAKALDAVDRCLAKMLPQLKRYKEMHTGRDAAHRLARRATTKRAKRDA